MDKDYLLRKKIIYNEDEQDCIISIYINNPTSIKKTASIIYSKETQIHK